MAKPALAFDVYGTLIDTAGVTTALRAAAGDQAVAFSTLWRQKQLEYTWRYALMDAYRDFRQCTRQALDYCCEQLQVDLPDATRVELMQAYLKLPVFADVVPGLQQLAQADVALYAFSNGLPADLQALLQHAEIAEFFCDLVSVHDIQTFKPNPRVYRHFAQRAQRELSQCWLISSNGFDVCGARHAGMPALWLQREPSVKFDPWPLQPTKTLSSFAEVAAFFA